MALVISSKTYAYFQNNIVSNVLIKAINLSPWVYIHSQLKTIYKVAQPHTRLYSLVKPCTMFYNLEKGLTTVYKVVQPRTRLYKVVQPPTRL